MVHNAFPHYHHEHEYAGVTAHKDHTHHHHDDKDHHHHTDEGENNQESKSFFDFLVKNHSHTKHALQILPATIVHVKTVKQVVELLGSNESSEFSAKVTEVGLRGHALFYEIGLEEPDLDQNPLRGPPSLG